MKNPGIKISADEYFERQKNAELVCKKKLKPLIIRSIILFLLLLFFIIILEFYTGFFTYTGFFIVWYLLIFICLSMFLGSLFTIRKEIRHYKFSLKRIEEYMLSGGIVIEIPKEDYEKFDLFKSKKERYKSKSLKQMKKDEILFEKERKRLEEQKEYERKVEEEFQKQYYADSTDGEK